MSADLSQMQDPLGLLRLGYAKPLLELRATRWRDGEASEAPRSSRRRLPLPSFTTAIPHVVMMATPQDLEDFALGFSMTEELIGSAADLQKIEYVRYSQGLRSRRLLSPACEEVISSRTRRLTGRTGAECVVRTALRRSQAVTSGGRCRLHPSDRNPNRP